MRAAVRGLLSAARIAAAPSFPLVAPAYPRGPYRFHDREYLLVPYTTDAAAVRRIVPPPLEPQGDVVVAEWISMPDSSGFGDYREAGVVVPCTLHGEPVNYVAAMYLNSMPAVSAGREIWGFAKKYAQPTFGFDVDTVVGTVAYGGSQVATGTMEFKRTRMPLERAVISLCKPQVLLRIIPDVDWGPRICELVRLSLTDVHVKEAYTGRGRVHLRPHVNAPLADLPVRGYPRDAVHIRADLTLPYGEVVHDYMRDTRYPRPEAPSMPYMSPSYPRGPSKLSNRRHMRVRYTTPRDAALALLPEDLELVDGGDDDGGDARAMIEWVSSDGRGFGKYNKVDQYVECRHAATGERGLYHVQGYVDTNTSLCVAREVFGWPHKLGTPTLTVDQDTIVGRSKYNSMPVAEASMAYQYEQLEASEAHAGLTTPHFAVKLIPSATGGTPSICELVRTQYIDVSVKDAYRGPVQLDLVPHVNCALDELPVKRVLHGEYIVADATLAAGRAVRNYLA